MSPFKQLALASASLFLLLAPVAAQTPGQRITIEQSGSPSRQEGLVRIQSSINFFVTGPSGEGVEAEKLRDRARRTVYEMAARECDLLREVLAKDCRMESVNVNIGRQFGQQQQEGYTVNGSMNLQITMK
ncbi:MAG: hypothetical protein P4M05_10305 [Bradyrhizobium sp.]|nr:hypothetical protein [Bradyrhizobium sp.]